MKFFTMLIMLTTFMLRAQDFDTIHFTKGQDENGEIVDEVGSFVFSKDSVFFVSNFQTYSYESWRTQDDEKRTVYHWLIGSTMWTCIIYKDFPGKMKVVCDFPVYAALPRHVRYYYSK